MDCWTAVATVTVKAGRHALRAVRTAASFAGHCLAVAARARHVHKLGTEVAGGALVLAGIAAWSVPCALIVGGLALVAAIEIRSVQR